MKHHRFVIALALSACQASAPVDPGTQDQDGPTPDASTDAADPPIDGEVLPDASTVLMLTDGLRNGTTLGHPVGGSFGPDGWTVTSRTDRLWFAIPRFTAGSIEFTVSNMSNANLIEADNEIFAMYEAGHGITEPIRYSPEFRNNHYKAMLRVYGSDEAGRVGEQKLMWGMCPSGAPGYDGCGCGSFFEEPYAGNGTWSGGPERLRIEWGNGITRFLRNGTEVVAIDWSTSGLQFGPSNLHFSIGTARQSAVDSAGMPIGAVFSDLVVTGTVGSIAGCQ
ncbi:MAG: hypothetical protein H0T42_15965 [Deltaproteobacteria bacterium]|nr:hypothetical protein [Deltaproteobacteria bacterium]